MKQFTEAQNARLIAAAPELYRLVFEELLGEAGGSLSFAREAKIRTILARIDGMKDEEDENEMKTFIDLVYTMRQAQKNYFKTRDKDVLIKSKTLEKQVDSMLDKLVGRTNNESYRLL